MSAHTGRMVPLERDDVDTDQIIPSEHCRRLSRTGFQDGLFAGWRREPGFVLDEPARAGATVLVAGANFGTGSSREPAVWALRDWGFVAVVAQSYGDIFRRNAYANGLLAVELPAAATRALRAEAVRSADATVTVDLVTCRVESPVGSWPFQVPARARWLLLEGLDEIAVTLGRESLIDAHERRRPSWQAHRPGPAERVPR